MPSPQIAEVAARPEQLTYKPFDFAAPDGDKYRHTLPGGVVVYVVPDHSLPLVKLQATFRTGAFREGANETGLAAMTAAMMRQGGTAKLTPEEFDQKADFLAAIASSSAGPTSATAALDVITPALGRRPRPLLRHGAESALRRRAGSRSRRAPRSRR